MVNYKFYIRLVVLIGLWEALFYLFDVNPINFDFIPSPTAVILLTYLIVSCIGTVLGLIGFIYAFYDWVVDKDYDIDIAFCFTLLFGFITLPFILSRSFLLHRETGTR